MQDLSGRVAFITGGASGIGRGLAEVFAGANAKVVIADIHLEQARAVADGIVRAGGTALAQHLDVADLASWTAAADEAEARLGAVSILCNNAGVTSAQGAKGGARLENVLPEEWHWMIGINTTGTFYGIKTFLPRFKRRGGPAHIVNTISMAGIVPQSEDIAGAYTVSKFAAAGLTEQLRLELMAFPDIRVSLLAPGIVATNVMKTCVEIAPYADKLADHHDYVDPYTDTMAKAMDPINVGRRVLAAIGTDEFYIFTHSEYKSLWEFHARRVNDGFGESAQPGYADPLPEFR